MKIQFLNKELEEVAGIYLDDDSIEKKRYDAIGRSCFCLIKELREKPEILNQIHWVSTNETLNLAD